MTPLHALADELGIERRWQDVRGVEHVVSDDTLAALCAVLHPAFARPEDAADILAARREAGARAIVEPVTVAWDDEPARFVLHGPASAITLSFGDATTHTVAIAASSRADLGDGRMVVEVPGPFPIGAHTVAVTGPRTEARAHFLAAPRRLAPRAAGWGLFAPVYALHDRVRPDAGDFGTLARFAAWAAGLGASVIGTLPILATFVGHGTEPRDPSPYAPVSRRFWNENYLDPRALGVDARVPPAAATDIVARAALVRAALEPLVPGAARDMRFQAWISTNPCVRDYAAFRAACEGTGAPGARYHEVAQWWCDRQLGALSGALRERGQALYLDFPLGTHGDGFDVAADPGVFVVGACVGAPPDAFFAAGQNWGFPPPHPQAVREEGYATLRTSLDAHLRFADVLRIDHVMGLDRLWYVPAGASAADGAYVRYRGDEQWAALCIAAAQHGATVVGENLGTVPERTQQHLQAHGALGMWVAQFETSDREPLTPPRAQHLACLDTHDLPPFATWWHSQPAVRRDAIVRTIGAADDDTATVLHALLAWLGASDARMVIASLEDLWLETEPQNRPGTPADQNFRRRGRYAFDDLDRRFERVLHALDSARRRR